MKDHHMMANIQNSSQESKHSTWPVVTMETGVKAHWESLN